MCATKTDVLTKRLLVMVLLVYSLAGAATCFASSVLLQWDPVVDTTVIGYKVYYQEDSPTQPFQGTGAAQGASPIDMHTATSATISGLDASHVYFFAVTSYNAAGQESPYSNIVSAFNTTPPAVSPSSPANGATGVNVALQANGGVATASSTYSSAFPVSSVNNGDRNGLNWGAGGGWNDATVNVFPDWVQITFNGQKTISEIDVFTLQDNYANPVAPTPTLTFSEYGITAFDVQYYNGTSWVTVPGGSISGNNLVWRSITFPAVTTNQIRVLINASVDGMSRLTEIEAYTATTSTTTTTTAAPTADTTAPVVALTAPAAGGTVSGTVSVAATATDNVGVSKVEFYVNGVLQATATGSPYTYNWDTTAVANGSYTLSAMAYDTSGNVGTSSGVVVAVNNTVATSSSQGVNVALQSNGGVATASSTYSSAFPVSSVNNGDRNGLNWGAGGGWNDATVNVFPDWVQITFNGQKTISEIDVFTLQDNYANPVAPTPTLTFSEYGITAFDVQYYNGTSWVTVPGGSISGNNLVWRSITFPAVTTNQIRVLINASVDGMSRLTEIEAYTATTSTTTTTTAAPTADTTAPVVALTAPAAGGTVSGTVSVAATATDNVGVSKVEFYVNGVLQATATSSPYTYNWDTTTVANGSYTLSAMAYDTSGNVGTSSGVVVAVNNTVATSSSQGVNVALQSNGGVATASSTYSSAFPVSSVNNGDRNGLNWGAGGGWNDATVNVFPDWVQITFNGQKTISEIDVFTLQDNYANPVAPTPTLTFSEYGITAFDVQYYNGTSWVTVPGGSISGNNLVWRSITFPAVTTNQIRVLINASVDGMSRLTEIEAY